MSKVVVLGDVGSHGGSMTTASITTDSNKGICRVGDTYACSIHGNNPIVSVFANNFIVDGENVAINGAVTQCGATITATGSTEAT